jgi:hypothetical protein
VGSTVVIAGKEDFLNDEYKRYSYICLSDKKRVSRFRKLVALEISRLKLV